MIKRNLQAVLCQLSSLVDQLIRLVQALEDFCIELDGD